MTTQLATRKLITLFTGGGGFDEGAKMAGFTPVLGVEIVPDIAHWAEVNTPGLTVIRSDVAAVDYSQYETPYHLHASPSCKNASGANSEGEEEPEDLSAAQGVCNALIALQPPCFSLENVYFYRTFQSFKLILRTLHNLGYAFNYWHLNSADYGVPQSRKRLILIALKDRKPIRPAATHTDPANLNGQMGMFGQPQLKPWVGWYEAIADIVHTLPDSEFAPWQLARLPDELLQPILVEGRNAGQQWSNGIKEALAPAMTVTATHPPRAFLVAQGGYDGNVVTREESEPGFTITANHNQSGLKAFLIPGDNTTNGVVRAANEPMVTVQSRSTGQCVHRAFIVDQNYGSPNDTGKERKLSIKQDNQPVFTVTAGGNKREIRAWLSQGRVVKMIPRALARFQSVPDNYLLPDDDKLACTIIGNMVPPLLAKAICESVKD